MFVVWYTKRRKFTGELALMYFFINGLGRFFIEGLRTDSLTIGGIRVSQMLAASMVVCSAALWMIAMNKVKKGTAPAWMAVEIAEQPEILYSEGNSGEETAEEAEEKTEESNLEQSDNNGENGN